MLAYKQRKQLVVGIGDLKLSSDTEDTIITYSLGSCIGLTLYDPINQVGGMIHCMLPLSKQDPEKARRNPYMFTDSGVQSMIQQLFDLGASRKNLIAKVAGGAKLLDAKGLFRIGERNYTVLRKVLWKNDILIAAEDVGESKSRTMVLDMATGKTYLRTARMEMEL
ncbi:MAG TPA: chemotaxis protein CheD [Candidatus Marinimicrobia bacterium]|nr:chemotaxis protein CheD [Candidatus Neomarinimicrobiota bacterium]